MGLRWNLSKIYLRLRINHASFITLCYIFWSKDPNASLQVKREESTSSSPSHKTRCFYKRSQMNCEEGETNINGINNDSIVAQSASKIDPTQCAVMSGGYCECRRNSIAKSELKPTVGGSACTCHYLPSFSFSLSPQFLSDRTKTILPSPNKISSRLIYVGKERDATFVLALLCPPFKWYRQKETGSWYILSKRVIHYWPYASKEKNRF